MVPITSAANCFVDGMNEFHPVYRLDGDGNVSETGVIMSVSQQTLNGAPWRLEAVHFSTAQKALAAVRAALPGVKLRLSSSAAVTAGKMSAIGTANSNFYIVVGDTVALAPAWVLLANSPLTPAKIGPDAADIEHVVSKLAPGIWGRILDAI